MGCKQSFCNSLPYCVFAADCGLPELFTKLLHLFHFSDPEGCSVPDPAVEALPGFGGGQEALLVRHDLVVQQQQRK